MAEINGLYERIADLKRYYQEAERMNLKSEAGELLADINYLEELRELRSKQEPFMNKVCVSSKACENDKEVVLGKIRAEIEQNAYPIVHGVNNHELGMTLHGILQVIDKYKAESEKT